MYADSSTRPSTLHPESEDKRADCVKMRTALHDTTLPTGGGSDGSQPIGKQSKTNQVTLDDAGFTY